MLREEYVFVHYRVVFDQLQLSLSPCSWVLLFDVKETCACRTHKPYEYSTSFLRRHTFLSLSLSLRFVLRRRSLGVYATRGRVAS